MNVNRMKADALRHSMETQAVLSGEAKHAQHIRDYCEYADATAEAAAQDVMQELPNAVQKEVSKQVSKQNVSVEIDKQSLKKAKAAIHDLFASFGKFEK